MNADIIHDAPPEFDRRFLHWVHRLEGKLSIRFADWTAYIPRAIRQPLPAEIALYYSHATPFGRLRNGWDVWEQRLRVYQTAWVRSLRATMGMDEGQARALVSDSPPLWPLVCSEKSSDEVGFVWRGGQIVVIKLDPAQGGRARPVAVGLRNWFLANITLEILWEEYGTADPEKLRRHPKVVKASGWPTTFPFPDHFALELNDELEER